MTKARWFALALCIAVALTLVAIPVAGATTPAHADREASGVVGPRGDRDYWTEFSCR